MLAQDGSSRAVIEVANIEAHLRVPFMISDHVNLNIARFGEYFTNPKLRAYSSGAVKIYNFQRATLLGSDAVLLHMGKAIRDTVRHISYWVPNSAVAEFETARSLKLKQEMPIRDKSISNVFVGFNAAWRNYAHWMQECLPKILAWQRNFSVLGKPQLLVPEVPPGSFQFETLRILGITAEDVVTVAAGDAVQLENVFVMDETDLFSVPSLVSHAGHTLSLAARHPSPEPDSVGERIYIHRAVELRQVANFDMLKPLLEHRGFQIVEFEKMTLDAQIKTMKRARYVIAEHGAGLINVMFCEPGAKVLETFNPMCVQPAFWSVASECGHQYGFLVGTHSPCPLRPDVDWNSAYELSPERLDAAILTMLGATSIADNCADTDAGAGSEHFCGEESGDFIRATSVPDFLGSGGDRYIQLFDSLSTPQQIPAFQEAALPDDIRISHYRYSMPPAVRVNALTRGLVWGNGLVTRGKRFFLPTGSFPPYIRACVRPDGYDFPWFWSGALGKPNARRIVSDLPIAVGLHPNLGFGNMVLEMLPKLYQLAMLRTMGAEFRLALSHRVAKWVREFVALYFADHEIFWYDGDAEYVEARSVIVPPMMHSDQNYHPAVNLVIEDALQRAGAGRQGPKRRLYVARYGDDRRLQNDAESNASLSDLGFEFVIPERMTVCEQIQLFAEAEMLVGEYGTALNNSIFSPPGARVVAINRIDWYLGSIGRLRRHFLAYVPLADGGFKDWRADKQTGKMYTVNPEILRGVVEGFLEVSSSHHTPPQRSALQLPAGANRKLVLSFCVNYGLEQVEHFIASIKASVADADICFFAAHMKRDFNDWTAKASGIFVFDAIPYMDAGVHIMNSRFLMFRDLLEANKNRYDYVMVSDSRDVVFQADPFTAISEVGVPVILAAENITFREEGPNTRWIRERYGNHELEKFRPFRVSCAGTTLGTAEGMRKYLGAMCKEIGADNYDKSINYDQGSHNYIARALCPDWCIVDEKDRAVSTLGCFSESRIAVLGGRILVDGHFPPVIYQWDRHRHVAELISTKSCFRLAAQSR